MCAVAAAIANFVHLVFLLVSPSFFASLCLSLVFATQRHSDSCERGKVKVGGLLVCIFSGWPREIPFFFTSLSLFLILSSSSFFHRFPFYFCHNIALFQTTVHHPKPNKSFIIHSLSISPSLSLFFSFLTPLD